MWTPAELVSFLRRRAERTRASDSPMMIGVPFTDWTVFWIPFSAVTGLRKHILLTVAIL